MNFVAAIDLVALLMCVGALAGLYAARKHLK